MISWLIIIAIATFIGWSAFRIFTRGPEKEHDETRD